MNVTQESFDAIALAFRRGLALSLDVGIDAIVLGDPVFSSATGRRMAADAAAGAAAATAAATTAAKAATTRAVPASASSGGFVIPFTVSVGAASGAGARASAVSAAIVASSAGGSAGASSQLRTALQAAGVKPDAVGAALAPVATVVARLEVPIASAQTLQSVQRALASAIVPGGAVQSSLAAVSSTASVSIDSVR